MKKLKVGVIGLGVGERHADGYYNHPDCELVALCDFSVERLETVGGKYPGVRLTNSAENLLNDPEIDVVTIASYDNYHFEQVKLAIANSKHIMVEKPVCQYPAQAEEIRNLISDKPQLKMTSNLVLRTLPRFQQVKEMISGGELGKIFYIEGDYNYGRVHKITEGWRGKIDYYSVVYGGGVHIIDLMLWLTGDRVVEVAAFGNDIATRGTDFRYNDMVVSILRFESGMVGKMVANFACVYPHFHALSVYGTKATFVNGRDKGMLIESSDPAQPPRHITASYKSADKGALIGNFIDAILGKAPLEVTPDDIFESMSVCFAVEEAAGNRGSVMVKYV